MGSRDLKSAFLHVSAHSQSHEYSKEKQDIKTFQSISRFLQIAECFHSFPRNFTKTTFHMIPPETISEVNHQRRGVGIEKRKTKMRKGGFLSIHILMICGKMSSKHLTYKLCVFKDGETIYFMNLYKKISCQQGFIFKNAFQKLQ